MLAIIVGAIMILATVARLGFIADLISKPTMIGHMNGLALTILVGQLPKLFGFKVKANGFAGELTGFAKGLANGEAVSGAGTAGQARRSRSARPDVPATKAVGFTVRWRRNACSPSASASCRPRSSRWRETRARRHRRP
jgi:Sulfate permease family